MLRARLDFGGVVDDLEEATLASLRAVVKEHADRVRDAARDEHAYTDRTGRLTASLKSYATRRVGDVLVAEVVADTDYAEYVERRRAFAYLAPAAERVDVYFGLDAEMRMTAAARGAGW